MKRLGPILTVLALAASACGTSPPPAPTAPMESVGASGGPSPSSGASPAGTVPQPAAPDGLALAPEADRVDLAMPTFTHPTDITNPLFPVSSQESVLLLGTVDDGAFRTEVTLLPTPRIIEWEGQQVATLVSQYVAFLDGRLHEVAYDFYAQADDGSVWYFGEDVFNFADGTIVDTHGTWIAGTDGPAAMIMPADPQVGHVYRPENIPGFVFEEVTVKAVDERLEGPLGSIEGGLLIEELHMDGATEDKTFAPGYGEFYTAGGGDVEALALAVPTDGASGDVPPELQTMTSATKDALSAAAAGDWDAASTATGDLEDAWDAVRSDVVPVLIKPLIDDAVVSLRSAVDDQDAAAAGQAAIDTARMALDLQLRHRPAAEIDLARFDLWLAQTELDAAAEDAALVNGDFFALDYVRDRILRVLEAGDLATINLALEELLGAVQDEDYGAVTEIATGMRETVTALMPTP
ncbi:MAG: hypothetical protein H0W98_07490 [Chloroflexi bacterium]|nr:hypothetical protein [Chloroflexota bacterium]